MLLLCLLFWRVGHCYCRVCLVSLVKSKVYKAAAAHANDRRWIYKCKSHAHHCPHLSLGPVASLGAMWGCRNRPRGRDARARCTLSPGQLLYVTCAAEQLNFTCTPNSTPQSLTFTALPTLQSVARRTFELLCAISSLRPPTSTYWTIQVRNTTRLNISLTTIPCRCA